MIIIYPNYVSCQDMFDLHKNLGWNVFESLLAICMNRQDINATNIEIPRYRTRKYLNFRALIFQQGDMHTSFGLVTRTHRGCLKK